MKLFTCTCTVEVDNVFEMQRTLNYQPCKVFIVKVRDLIGEELDSVH